MNIDLEKDNVGMSRWISTYNILRHNIMSFNLPPGEVISEVEIAQKLNLSRTPVRNAISKLVFDGLIYVEPQKETIVRKIDLRQMQEILFFRSRIETEIIKKACMEYSEEGINLLKKNLKDQEKYYKDMDLEKTLELDTRMHKMIFEHCGYGHVWKVIQKNSQNSNRVRYLKLVFGLNKSPDSSISVIMDWTTTINEHKKYIDRIEKKNQKGLDELVVKHVSNIYDDAVKLSKLFPDYFTGVDKSRDIDIFLQ